MSYTPPSGDQVDFPGLDALPDHPYTPPPWNACDFPGLPPAIVVPLPPVYRLRWAQAAPKDRPIHAPWLASQLQDPPGQAIPWAKGRNTDQTVPVPWTPPARADRPGQAIPWTNAQRKANTVPVPWGPTTRADRPGQAIPWSRGRAADYITAIPWFHATLKDPGPTALPWGRGQACDRPVAILWQRGTSAALIVPIPWGPTTRRDRSAIDWPIVWPIDPDPHYQIPTRGTYAMLHDIHLYLQPDRQEIPATAINVSIDVSSWAWQLTATVIGRQALAMIQDLDDPRVEVVINGYVWDFMIEDWTQTEQHGRTATTLSGRSITAILAAPYTLGRDLISAAQATAQQLALDELPLSGWTLDWLATADWLVPAGAWSYQGRTPIDAIGAIAVAAGAALQSNRQGQHLIIQDRYPTLPWDFATTAPDTLLPLDAITDINRRSRPAGSANAIHVRGELGGILGHVTRNGTAGDQELPVTVNQLITDAIAARALGGALIADTWPAPHIGAFTLPLSIAAGDFPLINTGDLVAIEDHDRETLGLATGINISANTSNQGTTVRQRIALDGGTGSNPFQRFRALTQPAPLLVGIVEAINGNLHQVRLTGGGLVQARGNAGIGETVFVRAGLIEGTASAMTAVAIGV